MDDVFESLTKEVKIIQSRDSHFKGRRHVTDSYFYTDLYKEELKNTDDEYTEYDVSYDEKSRDEVMIEVVFLLDCYSEIYKVPTVRIRNGIYYLKKYMIFIMNMIWITFLNKIC